MQRSTMIYALSFGSVLGLFLLYVATRPAEFRVARSRSIQASPEELFALINDLHAWQAWSPWEKMDPSMQKSFEGAPHGVGANYHWVGNKKVGEGKMTITESVPNAKVVIKLEFIKPFATTNMTTFTIENEGQSSRVTWAMEGHNSFGFKLFSVIANMDKMVGKDFENGLAAMDLAATQKSSKTAASPSAKAA